MNVFQLSSSIDYIILITGTVCAAATGVAIPYMNILFGEILDQLNEDSTKNDFQNGVNKVAILFGYVSLVIFVSGTMKVYCWSAIGERQSQRIREMYVASILRQEIGWFDAGGASSLSTKVSDLCGKVQDGIGRKCGDMVQYVVQFFASFVVALYLSWKLTLVLLVTIPAVGAAGYFMIYAVTEATNNSLVQYAAAGGLATETLNAIRTVIALNLQPFVIEKYRRYIISAMRVGIRKGFNIGISNGLLFGMCFMCNGLGFWYGSVLVAKDIRSDCTSNCMTGGDVMAVFFCVLMGSMALGQASPTVSAFISALAAADQMIELHKRTPAIDSLSTKGYIPENALEGSIEIRNVEFRYPTRPDIPVCSDCSLSIKPGEVVALCGPSGSGKSTIANLVMRFYDPAEGVVFIDGKDCREYNVRWLRSQIGYVGQEPFLFSGTIEDNIADGLDAEVSNLSEKDMKERIETAARLANAHDFIMEFPEGYKTEVGSRGSSLSGGQKQRIAIARALVSRPSILILDEATSALDATSEKLVQESIDSLQQTKSHTTIVIAHRLSTIRRADKIAVISDGKVQELGNHDELIKRNGIYADLVSTQMEGSSDHVHTDQETLDTDDCTDIVQPGTVEGEIGCTEDMRERKLSVSESGDAETLASKKDDSNAMWRIWQLTFGHSGWLAVGMLGAMIYGGTFPIWGYILARAQDVLYEEDARDVSKGGEIMGIYFCLVGVACLLGCTLEFWGMAHIGEKLSVKVRSALFESLMHRGAGFFDREENGSGSLTTQLAEDSRLMHKATGEALAKQIQALFTIVIAFVLGFTASWKIALVTLGTFPLNVIGGAVQMSAISGQSYDTEGVGGGSAQLGSAFTNMRTVSSLSLQHKVSEVYNSISRQAALERERRGFIAGIGFGGSQAVEMGTYGLVFWYGARLIVKDEITFLQLFTAILTLMMGTFGLGVALQDLGDQKAGVMAAKRVFRYIDEAQADPLDGLSSDGRILGEKAVGKIEFKNVSFAYPTRRNVQVFRNYSVTIEPGEVLALVGPSGSGKSTIMGLLLRFYEPDSGEILLDGVNIRDINIRWLRHQLGYVGQVCSLECLMFI